MPDFLDEYNDAVERDGHLPEDLPTDNAEKFEEGADDDLDGWVQED